MRDNWVVSNHHCLPRWSSSASSGGVCCVKKVLPNRKMVAATRRPIGTTSPHIAPPLGLTQQLIETEKDGEKNAELVSITKKWWLYGGIEVNDIVEHK